MDKPRVVEGVAKVNERGVLTIPAEVRKAIGMKGESLVVASAVENGNEILIRAQLTIDRDQAWFWTPESQAEEKKSAEDYRNGKVTRMSPDGKRAAREKLALFVGDPFHPSLRSKRMQGAPDTWESSINMDVRMTWRWGEEEGVVELCNIGGHDKTHPAGASPPRLAGSTGG